MTRDSGLVRRVSRRDGAIATAALIAAIAASLSKPAHADPFPTRDQNPLLGGFGLPTGLPASIDSSAGWTFAADFNWASTALVQSNAREALTVDAETQELRITFDRPLGERFALRFELPYRRLSAGSLDGFIDDWHDAFGLPEGARPSMPHDRLAIAYERDGVRQFTLLSPQSGLADASASLGYRLVAQERSSATAWLSFDVPIGETDALSGNERLDVSAAVAGVRRLGSRWTLFGQAAAAWLGQSDLLPRQQHDFVWSALAGVGWRAMEPIELKLQVDAHSAVFGGSELDLLGESVVLTVGGAIHLASGWSIHVGVSEDIAVETAPDVVFVIGLRSPSAF